MASNLSRINITYRKSSSISKKNTSNNKKNDLITKILYDGSKDLKKKSNIYKLLEDDDLVKSHIAEKDGNDINTYILTYKYYTRNIADNFFNIPENT